MRKQVQSPTSHGAKLGSPVRGEPEGRRDGATVAEPPWQASPRGAREEPEGAVAEPPWQANRGTRGRQPEESGESEGSRASRGRQPWYREPVPGSPGGLTSRNYQLWTCSHPPSPEAISLEKNGSSPTPVGPPWVVVGRVVVDRQSWGGCRLPLSLSQPSSLVVSSTWYSPRLALTVFGPAHRHHRALSELDGGCRA